MRRMRGLTLIEVLAATVLLAVLAAAVVPMLRYATDAARQQGPIDLAQLSRAADAIIADPEQFGIDALDDVSETQITWPSGDGGRGSTLVVRLMASVDVADHAWLVFSWDSGTDNSGTECVFRWVEISAEDESDA